MIMIDTTIELTDVFGEDSFLAVSSMNSKITTHELGRSKSISWFEQGALIPLNMMGTAFNDEQSKFAGNPETSPRMSKRDNKRFEVGTIMAFNGSDANYSAVTSKQKVAWRQYWG